MGVQKAGFYPSAISETSCEVWCFSSILEGQELAQIAKVMNAEQQKLDLHPDACFPLLRITVC